MSEPYVPELGQAVFGRSFHHFGVPDIWDAALCFLRDELARVMWNQHQKDVPCPFGNTGASFQNDVFSVEAYSWGDDDQPWNFKWRDVEISWYKYLGRGMSANIDLTPDLAAKMLSECLQSIVEPTEEA